MENVTNNVEIQDILTEDAEICPVCGEEITPIGHCKMCENCYWSACEL